MPEFLPPFDIDNGELQLLSFYLDHLFEPGVGARRLEAPERIWFSRTRAAFGEFSNFRKSPILLGGFVWPTVEHFYQAAKFESSEFQEQIRRLARPKEAKQMALQHLERRREDWLDVREATMLRALRAKFGQQHQLGCLLAATGEALLVERSGRDAFWGSGAGGTGANRLGEMLMGVREELEDGAVSPQPPRG